MIIKNKVKNFKIATPQEFLSWEFNSLKEDKDRNITKLKNAILKYGFSFPVICWLGHNYVIDGKGRKIAVQELLSEGHEITEIPYVEVEAENLDEAKQKALQMSSQFGRITRDSFLQFTEGIDLDFDSFEIPGIDKDLLIEASEYDDIIPENVQSISKLGDLYELGNHRVLCGDSTKIEDVERLMDGKKADMSFTSPPYNVGHNLGYKGKNSKYLNSNDNLDNYIDLIVKSTQLSLENAKDVFVNIQLLANNKKQVLLWLAELSENFKDIFFWKKLQVAPAMAENVANSQVEIIVLFGKNNNSRSWGNKKWRGNFSNHIETKSASGENKNAKIHNATFPVELPSKFITQAYNEDSIVMDLFLGSGSTLIASEKTGRICYGMELDPKYIDVIVQRWINFTGITKIKKNGQDIVWEKSE